MRSIIERLRARSNEPERNTKENSEAIVQALYQGILQRGADPDGLAHYSSYVDRGAIGELIRALTRSDEHRALIQNGEYKSQSNECMYVGRFAFEPDCGIEIDATSDQIASMLQRTQTVWYHLGKTEPHWSVLTNDAYLNKNIGDNLAAFYQTGVKAVDGAIAFLSRNRVDTSNFRRVLDYGCGVGRLSVALAARFPAVLGIDVSDKHIEHARSYAADHQIKNLEFMKVANLDQLDQVKNVDFMLTFIALQHNPPPLIALMIRKLFRTLNPGGCAVFQVPTYCHGYQFSSNEYLSTPSPLVPQMEMHAIPQRAVYAIASDCGCDLLEVREDNATGSPQMVSHTFLFQKRTH